MTYVIGVFRKFLLNYSQADTSHSPWGYGVVGFGWIPGLWKLGNHCATKLHPPAQIITFVCTELSEVSLAVAVHTCSPSTSKRWSKAIRDSTSETERGERNSHPRSPGILLLESWSWGLSLSQGVNCLSKKAPGPEFRFQQPCKVGSKKLSVSPILEAGQISGTYWPVN